MSTRTRRGFGVALIAISILSGILVAHATGKTGDPRVVGQDGSGPFHYTLFAVQIAMDLRWLVPLFALFAVGIACLVWPPRKPHRLI